MRRFAQRLSYSDVVATIALCLALGGTSYAAVTLGKGAVRARNVAPNAIDSSKVRDGSLLLRDFKPSQLDRLRGAAGLLGPQGPAGPQGPSGQTGAPGGGVVLGTTATLTGPVSSTPSPPGGVEAAPSVPLADPGWMQPVGTIALMAGAATVHVPTQCDTILGGDPVLSLLVSANREADGRPNFALQAEVDVTAQNAGKDVPVGFEGTVFGYRSTPTPRTFELFAVDSCSGAAQRFAVSDVRVTALLVAP